MRLKKGLMMAAAAVLLLGTGCAALNEMAAAQEKQRRLGENDNAMEIKADDLTKLAQSADTVLKGLGYPTESKEYHRGPGGNGIAVEGRKVQQTSLGNSIGMNLLAGALGSNGSKIVKRHEDLLIVWLWYKWNPEATEKVPGVVLMNIGGQVYDINQGDEKVNVKNMDINSTITLRDNIVAGAK